MRRWSSVVAPLRSSEEGEKNVAGSFCASVEPTVRSAGIASALGDLRFAGLAPLSCAGREPVGGLVSRL